MIIDPAQCLRRRIVKEAKLTIVMIACQFLAATLCGQDFFNYSKDEIRRQIGEIQKKYVGPEYSGTSSPTDFESVILFLQDPLTHFDAIKAIPDVQSYMSLYGLYLGETNRLPDRYSFIGAFMDRYFSTIDDARVPILTYLLLHCSAGIFGDYMGGYYVDLFSRSPGFFVRDLSKRNDWKRVVDDLVPVCDRLEEIVKRLGNSRFEKKFKQYVFSRCEHFRKAPSAA